MAGDGPTPPCADRVEELDTRRWSLQGSPTWQHKQRWRVFQVLRGAIDFRFGRQPGRTVLQRRLLAGEVWLLSPGWRQALAESGARWRYAGLRGWRAAEPHLRACLLPPREFALLDACLGFAAARKPPRGHPVLALIGELIAESQTAADATADRDRRLLALAAELAADPCACADVEAMCARAGCSSAWLRRRWPVLTGQRPAAWLRAARMRLARDLLAGGLSCTAVAERVGLPDARNLRRQFRRVYGCAPSRFRPSCAGG